MLRTGTHDAPATSATVRELADKFITFLETAEPPAGLFAPDVFCDLTVPLWRLQAQGLTGRRVLRWVDGRPGGRRHHRQELIAGFARARAAGDTAGMTAAARHRAHRRGLPLRPRSRPPGQLAAQPRGRGRRRSRIRNGVGGPGGKPRTRCWPPGASGNPAARVGS